VDAYHRLFADAGPHLMAGEASTNYLYSATACSRIHEYSSNARVLVILRDPVDRAYSEYWHFRRYGMEALTFDACIAEDDARDPHRRYIARGFYSHHVERYQRTFGADGVHVLLLDDLRDDALTACSRVLTFLGVSARSDGPVATAEGVGWTPRWRGAGSSYSGLIGPQSWAARVSRKALPRSLRRAGRRAAHRLLTRPGVPQMSAGTRARLRAFYAQEIDQLESVIARDLGGWRQ
jgi:hypothetical protein